MAHIFFILQKIEPMILKIKTFLIHNKFKPKVLMKLVVLQHKGSEGKALKITELKQRSFDNGEQ